MPADGPRWRSCRSDQSKEISHDRSISATDHDPGHRGRPPLFLVHDLLPDHVSNSPRASPRSTPAGRLSSTTPWLLRPACCSSLRFSFTNWPTVSWRWPKVFHVRSITLIAFGGVAQIGRELDRPLMEFQIAIAGPIASALAGCGILVRVSSRRRSIRACRRTGRVAFVDQPDAGALQPGAGLPARRRPDLEGGPLACYRKLFESHADCGRFGADRPGLG